MTASSSGAEVVEDKNEVVSSSALIENKFGFCLEELYKMAVKFYRENENREFQVSYENRNKLAAFHKQVTHGKFTANAQDAGFFDWIGNDRRQAWESLGDISKEEAMAGFVSLLDQVCPSFNNFTELRKKQLEEQTRVEKEELDRQRQQRRQLEEEDKAARSEQDRVKFEAQKQQIQEALNQQTNHQFRAYAEQQFPGNPQQQESLVAQLQEQHYQQYMSQVYAQQAAMQPNSPPTDQLAQCHITNRRKSEDREESGSDKSDSEQSEAEEMPSNPSIAPASMWTRKDIDEFKNVIRKESSEGVIKVGHGETVTVRVPTHEDGTCLFWEFSTDSYDIGFGVYFEWTIADSNTVSVHISESSDEDDDIPTESISAPAPDKGDGMKVDDLEKGSVATEKAADKPQMDEIVPVYRRDCHEEVYAGSHVYPGRGVYLLKFDNSYSLWRSKTLYYRVYYSK